MIILYGGTIEGVRMTVFVLSALVVINVFVIVIVLIALAGTKRKLDTVEMMLKDWQKREHIKGLPRKSRE
jgi:hypothetical protein